MARRGHGAEAAPCRFRPGKTFSIAVRQPQRHAATMMCFAGDYTRAWRLETGNWRARGACGRITSPLGSHRRQPRRTDGDPAGPAANHRRADGEGRPLVCSWTVLAIGADRTPPSLPAASASCQYSRPCLQVRSTGWGCGVVGARAGTERACTVPAMGVE